MAGGDGQRSVATATAGRLSAAARQRSAGRHAGFDDGQAAAP
jgi:hypothetical protein